MPEQATNTNRIQCHLYRNTLDMVDTKKNSKTSTVAHPGKNSWCSETSNHIAGSAGVFPNTKRDVLSRFCCFN